MGKYDSTRYNHNLNRATLDVEGTFGVPVIRPVRGLEVPEAFIDFNYAVGHQGGIGSKGVHFFLDDYRFERLWSNPDAYLTMLRRCACTLSPDFSVYTDWPLAVQVYNHWRKHWLGAYLQMRGCTVVPTVRWGDPSTYGWCFDGEPRGGVVAVGARGTMTDPKVREMFADGFGAMVDALRPSAVWVFGEVRDGVLDGYGDLVVPVMDEYTRRMRALDGR